MKSIRLIIVICAPLLLTACIGTVVGAVVDTTIEVVKIPFKVVGAAVDVVTGDDLNDLSENKATTSAEINSDSAAVQMENQEFQ